MMCRVLEVSTSGYYAWLKRPPSPREQEDEQLTKRIKEIHAWSKKTYGAPRIHAQLAKEGVHVGRKRVARLMKAAGVRGVSRRKRFSTTQRAERARPAPDRVNRDFQAAGPDRLWVADITAYSSKTSTPISTWGGWLYLAVVIDAWSRRIVGWSMATHLRTRLVLDALEMAIRQRRPIGVIHHSDQGSQYTLLAFGSRCREAGILPSMGSVGDAYDNALCESFFATLECELLERNVFRTSTAGRLRCTSSSKVGTIRIACIRPSASNRRSSLSWRTKPTAHSQALRCPHFRGNSNLPPGQAEPPLERNHQSDGRSDSADCFLCCGLHAMLRAGKVHPQPRCAATIDSQHTGRTPGPPGSASATGNRDVQAELRGPGWGGGFDLRDGICVGDAAQPLPRAGENPFPIFGHRCGSQSETSRVLVDGHSLYHDSVDPLRGVGTGMSRFRQRHLNRVNSISRIHYSSRTACS